MEINANETVYKSARQRFSHPLRGPNPMLGTPVKFVEGDQGLESRQHEEHWQSIHRQRQAKAFLKKPSKTSWGIAQPDYKPAKNTDIDSNRTLSFKRTCI
jgi:hypothetical protein